jgi:hypothetical protein
LAIPRHHFQFSLKYSGNIGKNQKLTQTANLSKKYTRGINHSIRRIIPLITDEALLPLRLALFLVE